jgi:hypothetical protein
MPEHVPPNPADPKQIALAAIVGLGIADVLSFFYAKASERDKVIADLVDTTDELECAGAILSEGEGSPGAFVLTWSWVDLTDVRCLGCGAIEGTEEYGTVGDGFDGYCPSCADKREADGTVEIG